MKCHFFRRQENEGEHPMKEDKDDYMVIWFFDTLAERRLAELRETKRLQLAEHRELVAKHDKAFQKFMSRVLP